MFTISNNPTLKGLSVFVPHIVYSHAGGQEITLELIRPQTADDDTTSRFPLVVFIQGSAWHFPDVNYEIPQLSGLSRAGYVAATVTHRNIDDGFPAPAYLQDVKTAIRFLRTNAAEYHVDPDRVYVFGTSSGGNTALLVGLTGDMEEFRTEEYPDVSDAVSAVIDCFGPTDLNAMFPEEEALAIDWIKETITAFCGGPADRALLDKMSPVTYVTEGKSYVPFMIAHGDQDELVPFSQSAEMAEKLQACGADVSLIRVEGAEHEGTFWSDQIWDIFRHFLDKQAGKNCR